MRCLVTGVAGFIGSHLAERLLDDGHEVIGVDAFTDYYARSLKEQNLEGPRSWEHFTFVEGDLLKLSLVSLLEGVDWIFHQAGQAGVRSLLDEGEYRRQNITATERLLDAAYCVGGVQRLIYASSSSVYGDAPALPVNEKMVPHPISCYGKTKREGERRCKAAYTLGVPTVALRYFTVYGARQRPDMAFHQFFRAILSHQPIVIYGDGQQTRDFTHVADVVEANIQAASSPGAVGQILNIAGGSPASLLEVAHLLEEVTDLPVEVQHREKQASDVLHTYADTSLAAELIGYQPFIALREGLMDEFAWIKSLRERGLLDATLDRQPELLHSPVG